MRSPRRIVHRDLKPGNIMLTKNGVKLLDFGLAKLRASEPAAAGFAATLTQPLTAEGSIVGTLQYMAPEQLEGKEADARTDVFAFGAIVYEMLAGRRAFESDSQASVIAAILDRDAPSLADVTIVGAPPSKGLLRHLDRLVATCLAKDPDERWQSASDLARELAWIAREHERGGTDESGAAVAPAAPPRTPRIWMVAAAGLALVALGLGTLLAVTWRTAAPEPMRFHILPPPGQSFIESPSLLAVSPDGRQVAFVAGAAANSQIWVRPLDAIAARPLADTNLASQLFWSADGRRLGFHAQGALKRIDVNGGTAQTLASGVRASLGSWSADGTILYAGIDGALWKVSDTGGVPTRVTTLDAARQETAHNSPAFLPDGRRFLYSIASNRLEHAGIFLGSLDGMEPRKLLPVQSNVAYASGYLLYHRENTLIAHPFDASRAEFRADPVTIADNLLVNPMAARGAFAVSASGVLVYRVMAEEDGELAWFDRAGRHAGTVGPLAYALPRLSPDGTRLVVASRGLDAPTQAGVQFDLWTVDLRRGLPSRFTFDEQRTELDPIWSADGAAIIYAARNPDGTMTVLRKASGGTGADEKLLELKTWVATRDVTRDGRYVLLSVANGGGPIGSDLALLALDGKPTLTRLVETPFTESAARFSPDGRWLAYTSNESGNHEIYVEPFPANGSKSRVSHAGGFSPVWRGDGRELFYVTNEGTAIMAVDIAASGATLTPSTPRTLFETRMRLNRGWSFDVTRDGQRFVIPTAKPTPSPPLTVVVNWPSAIARK